MKKFILGLLVGIGGTASYFLLIENSETFTYPEESVSIESYQDHLDWAKGETKSNHSGGEVSPRNDDKILITESNTPHTGTFGRMPESGEIRDMEFALKEYQKKSVRYTQLKDGHIEFDSGTEIMIDRVHAVTSDSNLFYSTPDLRCLYGDLLVSVESGDSVRARAILVDSNGDWLLLANDSVPIFDLYRQLLSDPDLSVRELMSQRSEQ